MTGKTTVSIGGVVEGEGGTYNFHIKGYDAIQQREFNDIFIYDGFIVRGKHIDPRQDPLSEECRLLIKQKIMDIVDEQESTE
ncbi:hypothetical protein [Sediminibacillus massiliensis]|uniref:hypothetical protein n=1 Tax=Sediminibacillus massiliensis TaxID=1926277 RepID=UPI0009883437|nr:hypothetical protein [Sediminibacillus massiliensis]